jgi:hypothetical protein
MNASTRIPSSVAEGSTLPVRRTSLRALRFAALLAVAAALPAAADRGPGCPVPPPVPANLEVPAGHRPYLAVHATGTQNYVCLPGASSTGLVWTFYGPQANGFDRRDEQVMTHFLSANPVEGGTARPTWQHSRDTSAVWARPIVASTDPAYVEPGAIAWLLLEIVGSEDGPNGGRRLAPTTYIQRVETSGGVAPADGCTTLGAKLFVPYETDYYFFRAE